MEFSSKHTGVGCHFLLQGIFLAQGLNLRLLHCPHQQVDSHHCGPGKPVYCILAIVYLLDKAPSLILFPST